jgi:O-antigen ligase
MVTAMAEHMAERSSEQKARGLATLALGFAVVAVVLVVPLLLDLGNLVNTYYFPKARALYILSPLLVLGLALLWRDNRRLTDRGVLIPVGLFMLCTIAATVLGVNPSWSVLGAPWRSEGMLTLLTYPIVLVGTMALVRLGYIGVWLVAALTGATIVAAYGITQYFGYEWLVRDGLRVNWWEAFSTTGHMNYLGAYMVLLLPIVAIAVVTAQRHVMVALSVVSVLVMYLALLFTFSRAAWASVALAFLLLTAILVWDTRRPARRYAALLAVLAVVTVAFFLPNGPLAPRPARATAPLARARSSLAMDTPSVQVRPYLWRQTLPLLLQRTLLGYGPEALSIVFPQKWDPEKQRLFGPIPMRIDKAHNDTLDTAMSVGLLGLAAYWWLILASVRRGWAAFRGSSPHRLVALAAVVGILAFWFDLQFGFSVVSVAPVFWSVMGAAAGLAPSAATQTVRPEPFDTVRPERVEGANGAQGRPVEGRA